MKKILSIIFLVAGIYSVKAQKVMVIGDCTVTYSISGDDAVNKSLAGAVKTFYVKGKLSRVDLNTTGYTQTIIYDNNTGTATVLKEVGKQKFVSTLSEVQWKNENKRFDGLKLTLSGETKTILNYPCKKVIATLTDGSTYGIYYAPSIIPSATENPYQFKDVQGFVLEYETSAGNSSSKITYTATSINFNPVPASRFEVPKSGYRVLQQ